MTPEYVLNPLAIYRMARRTVQEKHAPEESTSLSSTTSSRKNQPSSQQQRAEYNPQQLPIQGRSMNAIQREDILFHPSKYSKASASPALHLHSKQFRKTTLRNLRYSPALKLVGPGSRRERQWREQNGVDCHHGHQVSLARPAQKHLWKTTLISSRLSFLSLHSSRRLEVSPSDSRQPLTPNCTRHGELHQYRYAMWS